VGQKSAAPARWRGTARRKPSRFSCAAGQLAAQQHRRAAINGTVPSAPGACSGVHDRHTWQNDPPEQVPSPTNSKQAACLDHAVVRGDRHTRDSLHDASGRHLSLALAHVAHPARIRSMLVVTPVRQCCRPPWGHTVQHSKQQHSQQSKHSRSHSSRNGIIRCSSAPCQSRLGPYRNRNWRFKLETSIVSMSITSMLPNPLSARSCS